MFENPWKSIKKFGEIYVIKHKPRENQKKRNSIKNLIIN